MYYYRPERKRRSSPVRVLILLILIGGVLYVVTQRPELVTKPFMPKALYANTYSNQKPGLILGRSRGTLLGRGA